MRSVEITIERRPEATGPAERQSGSPVPFERRSEGQFPITIREIDSGDIPFRQVGVLHFTEDTRRQLTAVAETDPIAYGTILGQAIFQDRVRYLFESALDRARNDHVPLRVWLVVEDPENLGAVRWKRLCAPINGTWELLALCQDVPFSLYLERETYRPHLPISRRDLASVLLVSSPTEEEKLRVEPFDVASTAAAVTDAMEPGIPVDLLAAVEEADGPPTLDGLMKWLTENQRTMLHLVCHGALQGNESVLFLTGADGRVDTVSGSRLISRLRTVHHLPQFAFLSACQSASPDAEGALGGLAQRLVRDLGMKAVVAMTEPISIETAGKLSAEFYQRLLVHGEPDRALVEATASLADRPDILVPALYSCLGSHPLFDEAGAGDLTAADIDAGLTRLQELLQTRAPVLLQADRTKEDQTIGVPAAAAVLRATAPDQLPTLLPEASAAWQAALAEIDSVCKESVDISFASLAAGADPPPYDNRRPFRGLSPFLFEDREFFFGRDQLIADLRKRLLAHPFLAILGRSGSGKSSLVFAGLIPELLKADPALVWASFRPGETPIDALAAALSALPENGGLLVADQFEEIFTHTREKSVRSDFFDRLLAETARGQVLITMRAEFLADCAEHAGLGTLVQERQHLISPMSAEELRHATEAQTNRIGFRFEAGLAAAIIEEIRDEPGAMPLLQHALLELWNRRHGRWLKLSEYPARGGVRTAISAPAEAVYQRLTKKDQERVRDIFLRLTRLDTDVAGPTGARDSRRRVPFRHLVPDGDDPADVRALINELQTARLVVVTGEPPSS